MQTAGKIAVPEKERGDKGDDDDEVCIYLRVMVGRRLCEWFVIKTVSKTSKEPVDPVFDLEPNRRLFSGYTAVGSTIYSIGGREEVPSSNYPAWSDESYLAVTDVYYLDTLSLGVGWKKLAHPMNVARHCPYTFTIKSKIYVMGGILDMDILSHTPKVYDTEDEEQGWRILEDSQVSVPVDCHDVCVDGHAVVDDGKQVIVVSSQIPDLYCYNVEGEHSWEIYAKDILGLGKRVSSVVDGILYFLDPFKQGDMFGIELANPKEPKRVVLKSNPKYEWIPQPVLHEDYMYPPTFLVSVGEGKLAALWSITEVDTNHLLVYCSTIKMSRQENEGDHDYELEADSFISLRSLSGARFSQTAFQFFHLKHEGHKRLSARTLRPSQRKRDVCKEQINSPQANEQNSSINNNRNSNRKSNTCSECNLDWCGPCMCGVEKQMDMCELKVLGKSVKMGSEDLIGKMGDD